KAQEIPLNDRGKYILSIDTPDQGWTAYFVELTYPGVSGIPLKLTTGTVVLPDSYPYPRFESKKPMGHIQVGAQLRLQGKVQMYTELFQGVVLPLISQICADLLTYSLCLTGRVPGLPLRPGFQPNARSAQTGEADKLMGRSADHDPTG